MLAILQKKFLSVAFLITLSFAYQTSYGCHAIALVNFNQQTITGTGITVTAASDSPTCGCAVYWLDLEVRCVGEAFDAAPFNPGFWGPLGTYPYFQSAQMNKPNCVVQNYPGINIPFAGLCPGTTYQYRMRENHNGQVGPWCATQTFTVPGVLTPLTATITETANNICAGSCTTISVVPDGGCHLAVDYTWNTGATTSAITVCPNTTTTYTCTVHDDCSNLTVTVSMTINVVPNPIAGTADINGTGTGSASICSGDPVNLSITGQSGGVQWQSSPNPGGPYTNITGATNPTFNTTATTNTCYIAEISGCGAPVYSNEVCVTINPTPTINIPNQTACAGDPATLTPTVNPTGGTYSWNTGATSATLTDSPGATTTYTLTYTANGCSATGTGDIIINPIPTVTVNTVNICNGNPGVLTATPNPTGGTFLWNTGATTVSITDTPPISTTYTVTYTLNGCSNTGSGMINIGVNPQPSFTAPPNCDGNIISFFDNTPGNITAWDWDFGDGNTSNLQNPTHLYATGGTYNVTLTAYDGPCSGTATFPVTIFEMPVPSFTITPDCANQTTTFTNTSTIGSGSITVFNWDMTGGTPATANTQNATTIYNTPGTYNVELYIESDNGCADSITQVVVIPDVPVADFTFVEECLGTPTCFTDASTVTGSTINGWSWDFGDGNTDNTQNPCNNYATGGLYNVTLTVTAANGCTSLPITQAVNAYVAPTAGFTTSPVCFNEITQFTNTSTSSLSYNWDFGDGNTSTLTNPTHVYTAAGTYTVTLTAITGICTDVITQNIVVNPNPTANFSITPSCPNIASPFTDLSNVATGTITNWDWTFSSGTPSTSTQQNPSVTFTGGGNYDAELIVTTDNGCKDTFNLNYDIPYTPVADFSYVAVCVGNPTCFTDLSTVTNSTITGWAWDFDDGNTDATQNPCNNYANDGSYNVSLTVTSADGCVSTPRIAPVDVFPLPIASFTAPDVCQATAATFTNTSNGASNYDWDFGDGNSSTLQNDTHQYATAGTYNVTLTISSGSGCSDAITQPITIFPMPTANFSNVDVCLNNNPMSFTDLSNVASGTITGWDWDFGDTQTSTQQNPTNNYLNDGSFNVTLTVTTDNNCTNTFSQNVTVFPVPNVEFTPTDVCLNATTQFINSSTISSGTIASYNWDFGDGIGTSVLNTPTYVYGSDGSFNVTLTATSDNGCVTDTTIALNVFPNPVISFTGDVLAGCNVHCVNFTNTSTINSGSLAAFQWNFGVSASGIDATDENPTFCFSNNTSNTIMYDAQLTVMSDQGCDGSLLMSNYITVYPDVVAEFEFGPQPTTILYNDISFFNQSINGATYQWDFGNGETSTLLNPTTTYDEIGTYEAILITTSQYGCVDTTSHFIEIGPDFIIYVPNTFTPDGDGKNDVFFPSLEGYDPLRFNMQIFNRWGELIYETAFPDAAAGWDGMYKGIRAKDDTYVWKITVKDVVYGKQHEFVGHVNLLR